jgi:molybdopterin converting factor small subunit
MEDTNRPINVCLKLFSRAFPERSWLQVPQGARVRDLLEKTESKNFENLSNKKTPLPLKDVARDDLLLILNGRPIHNLQGYETLLEDGDVLAVFPVMAGG